MSTEPKAVPPAVQSERLKRLLADTYARPGVVDWTGNGKASDALRNEQRTGKPTHRLFHAVDVAELFNRYAALLQGPARGSPVTKAERLSASDREVALAEAGELWAALQLPTHRAVGLWLTLVPERRSAVETTLSNAVRAHAVWEIVGGRFERSGPDSYHLVELPPIPGMAGDALKPLYTQLEKEAALRAPHLHNVRVRLAQGLGTQAARMAREHGGPGPRSEAGPGLGPSLGRRLGG